MLRAGKGEFSEWIELWFSVTIHSQAGSDLFSYWGITCCLRQLPKSHVILLLYFNKANHGIAYSHFSLSCNLPGDANSIRQNNCSDGKDRQMKFLKGKSRKKEIGVGGSTVVLCLCLQPEKVTKTLTLNAWASTYIRFWKDRWILGTNNLLPVKHLI